MVEPKRTTQAALQEAHSDPVGAMRRILDNEPALTIYGYDDTSDPVLIKQGRHELLEAVEEQFAMSSEWFSRQQALDTPIGGIYKRAWSLPLHFKWEFQWKTPAEAVP